VLADLGVVGPDPGKGGKFLILPPGHEKIEPAGYYVLQAPSRPVFVGIRLPFGRVPLHAKRLQMDVHHMKTRVQGRAEFIEQNRPMNFECNLFPEKPLYALNETNIALFEPFTLGPLACSRSGRCLRRCCWGIDRERYPP